MVGVSTSNGCATCRKRSVKCDEARPACSQCKRGGRKCPGYVKTMKFIDEGIRVRSRRAKTIVCLAADPNPLQLSHSKTQRTQIVAAFLQDLFPSGLGPVQHSYIGGWLWMVPAVMHRQSTLDLAAESLACVYFAKKPAVSSRKSHAAWMRSYDAYSRALGNLSEALKHPKRRFSSETLCATLLLVHYERFSSLKSRSWLSHAEGVGQLIKMRGPARHTSGIDHAILMASRGYIISEALMTGKSCFLEQESWQNVQLIDHNSQLIPIDSVPHHEGMNYFAQVPGLVQKARELTYPVDFQDPKSEALRSNASYLRSSMLDWYIRAGIASKRSLRIAPSNSSDQSPYYYYDSSITSAFAVNHCACLILINNILDLLSGYRSHGDANKDLAIEISLSATYCFNTGFCGAQALMLTLPVALTALPHEHPARELVQKRLEDLEESYIPIHWNPKILEGKLNKGARFDGIF